MTQALHLINGKSMARRLADPNGRVAKVVQVPKEVEPKGKLAEVIVKVQSPEGAAPTEVTVNERPLGEKEWTKVKVGEAGADVIWQLTLLGVPVNKGADAWLEKLEVTLANADAAATPFTVKVKEPPPPPPAKPAVAHFTSLPPDGLTTHDAETEVKLTVAL